MIFITQKALNDILNNDEDCIYVIFTESKIIRVLFYQIMEFTNCTEEEASNFYYKLLKNKS